MRTQQPARSSSVPVIKKLRRTLRKWRRLRKVYYKINDLISPTKDPAQVCLIPEDDFSRVIHELTGSLIERVGKQNVGDCFEFGVYNGSSLSYVYRVFQDLGLGHVRFFGFDSFEGLPPEAEHEDGGAWMAGQCSCSIEVATRLLTERQVDWSKVFLTKGWFKDTLTPAFIQKNNVNKASFLMVDCDLYSSTVTSLDFAESLIKDEAIVVFDDWFTFGLAEKNMGEKRAFEGFLARHPEFEATEVGSYSEESLIFRVVRRR